MSVSVRLHCPACAGPVDVSLTDDEPVPSLESPDELDTAHDVSLTRHAIDAHLEDIGDGL